MELEHCVGKIKTKTNVFDLRSGQFNLIICIKISRLYTKENQDCRWDKGNKILISTYPILLLTFCRSWKNKIGQQFVNRLCSSDNETLRYVFLELCKYCAICTNLDSGWKHCVAKHCGAGQFHIRLWTHVYGRAAMLCVLQKVGIFQYLTDFAIPDLTVMTSMTNLTNNTMYGRGGRIKCHRWIHCISKSDTKSTKKWPWLVRNPNS